MIENVQIIGKISLAELRMLSGMTQKEFSEYVEIPYTTYRRYEKNIGNAGFSEIIRICDKTGVGVEKLKI